MRLLARFAGLTAGLMALATVAPAYYHWTYFAQRTGALTPMRLRFDVNALPGQTVSFFIPRQGPAKLVDGDSYRALASELRRAGETWNVGTSALQVRFGGYRDAAFKDVLTDEVAPGIDVVFDDDLPPGVLALSEPLTYTDLKYLGDKNSPGFAPILRSRLQLANDLAARGQASFSDDFFATLVHEFGHTLGLQHSMTGGAMSTSLIRGTSKALPLTADDVAGISVLYPTAEFKLFTGMLAGKVNVTGTGANLASVVALAADGTAIGSMTQPDGTYRIEGLPPGDYIIYAHPLPPAQEGEANPAGIVPPQDLANAPFLASSAFTTRFYPSTTDWTQATKVKVEAGRQTGNVDFAMQPVVGSGIFNLRLFGYLGANRDKVVHAPPVPVGFRDWLAVQASGMLKDGQPVAGLKFAAIGDAAKLEQNTLRNFPGSDQFLLIVGDGLAATKATPVAVVMSTDTDLYVLPNALSVTPSKHPLLKSVDVSVDPQGRAHARIVGDNIAASTRVVFDGADATSSQLKEDGSWDVMVPPGFSGHVAAVELLGVDGQTSAQLLGSAAPLRFAYPSRPDGGQLLTPGEINAGTDAVILIEGPFANFQDGETVVGFGTSDVVARETWVMSGNQLAVNVSVNPKAKLGNVPVTISTGLQFITDGPALQLRPKDDKQPVLYAPMINETTGLDGAPEGATVLLSTSGLPQDLTGWSLVVGDGSSPITRGADGKLRAVIPASSAGTARRARLAGPNGATSPTILFQVDGGLPVVESVTNLNAVGLSAALSLRPGDRVSLMVTGLAFDGLSAVDPSQVLIRVGGIRIQPVTADATSAANKTRVEFVVPANLPSGDKQPMTVGVGTRVSAGFPIAVVPTAADEITVP